METEFLFIAGRPETFPPPPPYDVIAPMMELPEADGVYEMIVGRPETWQPGAFEADPNRQGPVLTALVPASAVIGGPDFTLRVQGSAFSPGAVIIIAGVVEPTTFVSPSELTTGWNMALWTNPDPAIQVLVRGANGVSSQALPFDIQEAGSATSRRKGH